MGIAVTFKDGVFWVDAAVASSEHFTGRANVSAVEEDDGVEASDSGVHRGYAGVGEEELPGAGEVGT